MRNAIARIPRVVGVALLTFAIGYALVWKQHHLESEGEEEEEEVEEKTMKDVQVIFGICVTLVAVTIAFEKLKHHVEHDMPHHMIGVVSALFGELTVLGFIALYVYFMLQTGLLPAISRTVYGNPKQLVELFESVHFILFFVMVTFLVQAYMLVAAVLGTERRWQRTEKQIASNKSFTPASSEVELRDAQQAVATNWLNLFAWFRLGDAEDAFTYALLRQRFIAHRRVPSAEVLPRDFNFAGYLRRLIAHTVTEILHVTEGTWVAVVVVIFVCLEMPIVAALFEDTFDFGHPAWLVGFSALLWLCIMRIDGKLSSILGELTPCHDLLSNVPKGATPASLQPQLTEPLLPPPESPPPAKGGGDVGSFVSGFLSTFGGDGAGSKMAKAQSMARAAMKEAEKYVTLPPAFVRAAAAPGRAGKNPHEHVFWGGAKGPEMLLLLLRTTLLLNALVIAVAYSWLFTVPQDMPWLLAALVPGLHTAFCTTLSLVRKLVLATSVEGMRKQWAIKETLLEMKTENTLRILKLLSLMQVQASRLSRAAGGAPPPAARPLDAYEELQMREAFNFFDSDKSGSIDEAELAKVMLSLGTHLEGSELRLLFLEMDADGSGKISFDEFCRVMSRDPGAEQTPLAVAEAVFAMIDNDRSGKIETTELKALLRNFALSEEEVDNAAALFDVDHSGDITKKEFAECIERMKSFAK